MARAWAESVRRYSRDLSIVIGLVDLPHPAVDYSTLASFEILLLRDIGIPELESMVLRYTIIELNTAVKPFFFRYLFDRSGAKEGTKICYFDPDIVVYSSLEGIELSLETANVLLTPHLLSPISPDGELLGEHTFLNYGIYNLGFCGMRWSATTQLVLNWWSERLAKYCKAQVEKGIFVDQLWMNHAPIFFDGIKVSHNRCINVAYWNLHERRLHRQNDVWMVNGNSPLEFYHFSSFEFHEVDSLGKYSTRYSLVSRPEMRPLFDEYRTLLREYGYLRFKTIPCYYDVEQTLRLANQRREYYLKHPFRLIADYWKSPWRLLTAVARALHPKRAGNFISPARDDAAEENPPKEISTPRSTP
jgi:hypothetical protein